MQAPLQIKEIVAQNIGASRAALGLTRKAFGELVDADPMLVYKWEKGLHRPNDDNLARLASCLKREIAWFYTDHSHAEAAA